MGSSFMDDKMHLDFALHSVCNICSCSLQAAWHTCAKLTLEKFAGNVFFQLAQNSLA